jgi:ADP-heptose:LPS heptosyltransferase
MSSVFIAPRKILVIKIRSLGDTVLLSAGLTALKKAYPMATIHVFIQRAWADCLEGQSFVDHVWKYDKPSDKVARARSIARWAIQLRKEKYDCVINFNASPSTSALAYALGSKIRAIHFHGEQDNNRYSTVMIPNRDQVRSILERDLDTVNSLGINVNKDDFFPKIVIPPPLLTNQQTAQTEEDFKSLNLIEHSQAQPRLIIGLGASRETKIWPIERFVEIAARWVQATQGSVVILTGKGEESLRDQFLQLARTHGAEIAFRLQSLHAQPLSLVMRVIQDAEIFFGNDAGPKHLSVALGLKTVTLFGPEDPFYWHPYPLDRHPYFYIDHLDCRNDPHPGRRPWCGISVCIEKNHQCMRLIPVEEVFKKLYELFKN